MTGSTLTRGAAAVGAFGLAGASLVGGGAAVAAPVPCAYPGSVQIVPDVCQVVITADGVHTFPASLGKVSAVVVGAGGGGWFDVAGDGPYGGGGGEVIYVDSVATGTPLTVDIGEGGSAGAVDVAAGDGEDTVFGAITARGGLGAMPDPDFPSDMVGGTSGNGNLGDLMGGGGAAGAAPNWDQRGPGYLLSAVPGADPDLFPASADGGIEYGLGGIGEWDDNPTSLPPVVANSGAGGTAFLNWEASEPDEWFGDSTAGADGVVVVRYEAASLASTGPTDAAAAIAFGAAAAIVGGGLVAASSTMRRRSRTP